VAPVPADVVFKVGTIRPMAAGRGIIEAQSLDGRREHVWDGVFFAHIGADVSNAVPR
jgi:hypothetical protein